MKPSAPEEAPWWWRNGGDAGGEDGDTSRQSERRDDVEVDARAVGRDLPGFARPENASEMMAHTGVANTGHERESAQPGAIV